MQLKKWLRMNGMTVRQFAAILGITRGQVRKYIYKGVIPKCKIMLLIFAATRGEITPDDFYDIALPFIAADSEESQIRFEGTVMKLEQWLKVNDVTIGEFAAKLGVLRSQVHKYVYEGVIPRYKTMRLIFELTGGAVTPNTFYNIAITFTVTKKAKPQFRFMEAAND